MTERGQRELSEQPFLFVVQWRPRGNLPPLRRDERRRRQLDQRFEKIKRIVMSPSGILGVIGAAVQLGKWQRKPQQILAVKSAHADQPRPAVISAFYREGESVPLPAESSSPNHLR